MHSITLLNGNGDTSIAVAQEMSGYPLAHFQWDHSHVPDTRRTVYTDTNIRLAAQDTVRQRIGILIEAREFRPGNYQAAVEHKQLFDAIFTYDEETLKLGHPFMFYPLGGNYIKTWGMFPKSKMVSIIVGQKHGLPGWDLRFDAMKLIKAMDVFGFYELINPKTPAIRPYRFSIIIEACYANFYFGEKLIDCLSQGTIPIYWGCPSIGKFFDERGFLIFHTINDLEIILSGLTDGLYNYMLPYARQNLELAKPYRLPEDWLFENHPQLFGPL